MKYLTNLDYLFTIKRWWCNWILQSIFCCWQYVFDPENNRKHREFNRSTCLLFVNFIKAFCKVKKNKLWRVLNIERIHLHLVDVIKNVYLEPDCILTPILESNWIAGFCY